MIQAQSDIFLGWTEGRGPEERHFHLRQLRDWKGSVEVEGATPEQLTFYADLCGRTLARGHAESGDPVAISSYMGKSSTFEFAAIAAFAEAYAAQNLEDFRALRGCHRIRPSRGRRADVTSTALEARGRSRWARVDEASAHTFAFPIQPHRVRRSTDAVLLVLSVTVLAVSAATIDEPRAPSSPRWRR